MGGFWFLSYVAGIGFGTFETLSHKFGAVVQCQANAN
jgi:hypothetical protein